MIVPNRTTSAQYFHLLRRQGLASEKRPLVVFTPKSLLREAKAASPADAFPTDGFQEVLRDPLFALDAGEPASGSTAPQRAGRILFCSCKVYYDLAAHRATIDDVMIVRLEQP
jgi:2-oxoglutarate dehydrogenase complex dehydrogenase (E1) component-like enzyme